MHNKYASSSSLQLGTNGAMHPKVSNEGADFVPQFACNAEGHAVAAWSQSDGEYHYIWAARYAPGEGWSISQQLEDNMGNAFGPQASINSDGSIVVMWYQDDGTYSNVWVCWFNVGAGWGEPQLLQVYPVNDAFDPQVEIDDLGNVVAVWTQFNGQHDNIWANRFVADVGWGTATCIQTNQATQAGDPKITMDANGNAVAHWVQCDPDGDHYWSSRYNTDIGWHAAVKREAYDSSRAFGAQSTTDTHGYHLTFWDQLSQKFGKIWNGAMR
jgi:hypothetical protein